MEVKDINSISTMLVSNRSQKTEGQNGGQTALQNFREFFAQGNLFDFQTVEKSSTPSNSSALNLVKKTDIANKTNKSKTSSVADKKDSTPIKENKQDKINNKSTKETNSAETSSSQNKDAIKDKEANKTSQTENTSENSNIDKTQQDENVAQGQTNNSENTEEAKEITDSQTQETVDETSAETDVFSVLNIILPENLQNMGAVTVYNSLNNTYSVMTGEEISDMLSRSSDISAYLSGDEYSDITIMPTIEQASSQMALEGFEEVQPEVMKNITQVDKQVNAVKSQDNLLDENIAKQSDKLAEMIPIDKRIKVDVNVEEENFSYQTAKVTVKEVMGVADNQQNQGESKGALNAQTGDSTYSQIQSPNSATNVAVPSQSMSAQDMVSTAKIKTQTTAIKAMGEVSSTNMSQLAGVDGAAQGLKSENGVAAENKTSFRDIYKGMSREVAEQVKVNITKSAVKGVDSIEIKLKPEELGHIEIKMQLSKDGKLQAHIIASRAETGEMLQKELPTLEKAFSDAGFNLDEGSLSFSYREENSAQEQNNELRNFIGRVLEQDAENENTPEYGSHISEVWDGTSALNIRV